MHVQSLLIQLISGVNLWPVGSLTFLFRERALCAILIHFCGCRKEACSSRYRGPLRRIFPSFLPCDAIMQAWALNAPLPFILSRMKLHPNPTPHPDARVNLSVKIPFFSAPLHRWSRWSQWQIHGMRIDAGGTACSDKGGWLSICGRLQSHCDALLPLLFFFCSAVRDQLKGLAFFSSFWGRALLELTQVF